MTPEAEVIEKTEIIFAIEGHDKHFAADIGSTTTVIDFAKIAATIGRDVELIEVFIEDEEDPLAGHLVLIECLSERFAPVHVAKPGRIKTTVEYNGRHVERPFRPSTTIARVIEWAIGKTALDLEGNPSDYQLKHKGQVLSADQHLGQVTHGHKAIELSLVFKIKPQG